MVVICQSTPNGTILFNITASDLDQPGTPNSEINFSLAGATTCAPYTFNPETGVLKVTGHGVLTVGTCTLVVIVTDNGSPQLSSSAIFTITVIPDPPHGPVFENTPLNVSVSEDPQGLIPIKVFTVTDADAGLVDVSIIPSDKSSYLDIIIDSKVSMMTTFYFSFNTALLDRETFPLFNVTLLAIDNADHPCPKSSTTELTVFVLDENDNNPVFLNDLCNTVVNIPENATAGQKVVQMNVTDADEGINAKIFFSLLNENDTFAIDSKTGCITVIGVLLHANTPQYVLQVMAVDKNGATDGRSATTQVTVNVLEVNDNYPQFVSPANGAVFSVNEDAAIGTLVVDVDVTDSDTGESAEVTIGIEQDGLPFTVQGTRLVVSFPLDYEVCMHD